jgi:hypothetical protein
MLQLRVLLIEYDLGFLARFVKLKRYKNALGTSSILELAIHFFSKFSIS